MPLVIFPQNYKCPSQWDIKHVTGIPYYPQGQAVIKRHNRTLKDTLLKQKGGYGGIETPHMRIHRTLLTLNFLNLNDTGSSAANRHWVQEKPAFYKNDMGEWESGMVQRWG